MNKTTTKNQVIDYLQWSSEEYEERLFLSILKWCQHYGAYPSIIQQLLANAQINKWFLNEYNKAELQFLKITEVVPNNTEVLRGHYKACTAQVMAIYPAPLINSIKRNREFSNAILDTVYYAN
ncbi:hypothetical protein [Flavobacterium facile]|uniref:hypothetical protein n=1 Tax=Flavobacterium facile TaxID=2893174 RepID=UPI002E7A6133|nr:hypothetical protein [Flavobacterium sp. T-12]